MNNNIEIKAPPKRRQSKLNNSVHIKGGDLLKAKLASIQNSETKIQPPQPVSSGTLDNDIKINNDSFSNFDQLLSRNSAIDSNPISYNNSAGPQQPRVGE